MRFVKPLDVDLVSRARRSSTTCLVTVEENVVAGRRGQRRRRSARGAGHPDPAAATGPAGRFRRPRRSGAAPREVRARRPRRRRVHQLAVRTAADGSAREAGGVGIAAWRRRVPSRSSASPAPRARRISPTGSTPEASHGSSCALDEGAPVPVDPRAFAGIALMGGPMSVNDALPWNAPLSALLRAAVDSEVPVIGHCLGGQLLAQALGAPVTRAPVAEIGWLDVDVCDRSAQREWFGGGPRSRRSNGTTTRSRCRRARRPC